MEDFAIKRSYLNHLKQISAIKNGHVKSDVTLTKSRLSPMNTNPPKQNLSNISNTFSKFNFSRRNNMSSSSRNKSTEQIMKSFNMQKQNLRLVERIGTMSSQINMRRYQKEYFQNQKLLKFHCKIKKLKQYFTFKIFDIKFQKCLPDPEQVFTLYQINTQKKKFITKGTIFQLRKHQIRTTKNQINLLKIQGRNSGVVDLKMNSLLSIKKNKEEIGNIVIDIV